MINNEVLVQLLADGHFHSGEKLALALKVSRTAVWKRLKKLLSLGLVVDSVKGKGYRLSQPVELLNKDQIKGHLLEASRRSINQLILLSIVDSTNSYLLNEVPPYNLQSKANVCLAEYQSAGRGRRGRQWLSPYGCNVYLSVDWQFDSGVAALEGLSLAVGVAIARALSSLSLPDVALKWPNDILLNKRKLGGVLIDVVGDHSGPCRAIVGVGINVGMPEQVLGIDQPWIDLNSVCQGISRNQLAAALISQLTKVLTSFEVTGLVPYIKEWRQLDAFRGKLVNVASGNSVVTGVCCGIVDNGALVVDVDGVRRNMHSGELSLRLNNES